MDYEVVPNRPTMEVRAHLRSRKGPNMTEIFGSILLVRLFVNYLGIFASPWRKA
jgi:hypothetical protein